MCLPLTKKAIRLVLFALLLGCLGLFITSGQADAATSQANVVSTTAGTSAAPPGCASWNAYQGICYYWAVTAPTVPVGCAAWNAQAQVCTAWTGDITYPSVSTFIYGLRYQCSSWNSKHHVCTHWKTSNNNFSRRSVNSNHNND